MSATPDPFAVLRSRGYVTLLIFAAVVGVPVSALAYGFLKLVDVLQTWVFVDLPDAIGDPVWWPVVPLTVAGVLVASAIRYLPGRVAIPPPTGSRPAPPCRPQPNCQALRSPRWRSSELGRGPRPRGTALIALGGGFAVLLVRLAKRDAPDRVTTVIGASGKLRRDQHPAGSPLLGAFLFMSDRAGRGDVED